MSQGDKYVKLVEWSDEDGCFIGSCPELFYGGCHGSDPRAVFDELCQIVDEAVENYVRDGRPLPKPMSGKQFVNALQSTA
ncbi:MAG: pilus assembly protein HicB [Acidobacteria bacterium RIFCSPLOWO2_02_FULL_59_13]|nr:MAG: pilus assembly protein HicB [Acidobacteria bacterium RIFCSPLOWO2_02_FULL_59_13]OFW32721.1 MAG: pilus assembly protein HicB [Acidobacteria bacterium RIFCSPLOWO2_12_FULL_60_22]